MALVTESSARWARTKTPSCSRVNQATCWPAWTAAWPRASSRNVLPVPEGPQTTRFSCRPIHSTVRSAAWVGAGIDDRRSSHAPKVLPVGNAARARRVASAERSRPATSSASRTRSTSAGSHRWALAVASTRERRGACEVAASAAAAPPARRPAAAAPAPRRSPRPPAGGGREVQVVDDQADVIPQAPGGAGLCGGQRSVELRAAVPLGPVQHLRAGGQGAGSPRSPRW